MNAYEKIAKHHAEHIYKKGAHKGDAPVSQRGKSHFRVIKHHDCYAVRMYNTDILTIMPDDEVIIDTDGYITHNTTVSNLNEALGMFVGRGVYVGRWSVFSYSQTVIDLSPSRDCLLFRYYDGIKLKRTPEGTLRITSELKPLQRKRINKDKVARFNADVAQSGFKDAFKILHSVAEPHSNSSLPWGLTLERILSSSDYAEHWPAAIRMHAFQYHWNFRTALGVREAEKIPAPAAWAALMKACKGDMYEVIETNVYSVEK